MAKRLSARQQKFVEVFGASKSAVDACSRAGFKGTNKYLRSLGYKLLQKPQIAQAIKEKQMKDAEPLVASREARQEYLVKFITDDTISPSDRLRALDMLKRSCGDYLEKLHITGVGVLTTYDQIVNAMKLAKQEEQGKLEHKEVRDEKSNG